jgi:hypothetical protein
MTMGVFDVLTAIPTALSGASGAIGRGLESAYDNTLGNDPGAEAERKRKELLYAQAHGAGRFAGQGERGYRDLGQQGMGALSGLQALAQGQNSVSAEQLRQGLQQNLAAQQSMAASASPANAAMAARTAAIQGGRLGAGLAGQQAIAGLQERNQAQQQYAALLQALRGQDLQAALGSRQNAMTGYGAQNSGAAEKSWWEKFGPAAQAGASSLATALSDRRLKTEIKDGEKHARAAAERLGAHLFKYKSDAHGAGQQFGVMTDELKRAGLGHAVISTPQGEAVHGAKLATSTAAMVGSLARRLAKLEGASK